MKELLFDMHVHTSGISRCSRVPAPELVRRCKLTGLDGIVLTNHFAVNHVDGDPFEWRKKYEEEFYITQKEGEKTGLAVLFGIEVTPLSEGGRDFLIYGVDPDFLYQEKMLYEYNQAQLCSMAREAGAVFVNAHPFRNGKTPKEPEYLDGVEVNCQSDPDLRLGLPRGRVQSPLRCLVWGRYENRKGPGKCPERRQLPP